MANKNKCLEASGKKQLDHIESNTPVAKSRLYKTIAKLDTSIESTSDWVKDKVIDKLKFTNKKPISKTIENSNFKRDSKGVLETENSTTNTVLQTFVKKQTTTDSKSHTGLLQGISDTIGKWFRPFKNTKRYDIQYALITNRESAGIAYNSVVRKLNYLYNKDGRVSDGDLQNMIAITLSGTVLDNFNADMKMPMKKTIFNKIKEEHGDEYLEKEIESIKTGKEVQDYLKRFKDQIEVFAKNIRDNNKDIKRKNKEIENLIVDKKSLTVKKRKAKTDIEKQTFQDNIVSNNIKIDDLKQDIITLESNNNELKINANKNKYKLNEENVNDIAERQLYANSLFEIREKFFGKEFVKREKNGEDLTLKDIDKDSELGKDTKLFNLYKGRVELFNKTKDVMVARSYEVLGNKQGKHIENSLHRFENYYKNVVNDVELAVNNYRTGTNINQGLKNNSIGEYIQRMGTNKDIDNNILYVDTIALGQIQQQIIQLDFIETIKGYDLNKEVLQKYQSTVQDKLNSLVTRINTDTITKDDKNIMNSLKHISREISLILSSDPNIDPELLNVIGEIGKDNAPKVIDGQEMNLFERIDHVFDKSIDNMTNEMINNIDKASLSNFYYLYPHYKNAIDYFVGNTKTKPNATQLLGFLEKFSTTNLNGSFNANNIYKLMVEKHRYKKSIESKLQTNYKDFLPDNLYTDYVLTTSNGNPINYNVGNKKINQIKIGTLLDVQTVNPESLSEDVFNQFMAQVDDDYLDVLFKNQDIMILPKDVGDGLIESLTPANDIGKISKAFNKWLRPMMILSPERILKFNLNTAFASDVYRITQTNPKALGNVGESIRMISEFFKTGEVQNKVDPGDKVYDNKQNLFYEFSKLFGGQFENEMNIINQKIAPKQWDKLMNQITDVESNKSIGPKKRAERILKSYLDFVGPLTNAREMVLRLSYALEVAKEIDGGKNITYGASNKAQANVLLEKGENFKFASSVANQNFIAYKEAGNLARRMNRAWFPFFLFPEGNIKWHYRLYKNYIGNLVDKDISYGQKGKTVGKMGISLGIQLGLAQAIWNLIQRGIGFAPDEEDIPEYYKGNEMPFDNLFQEIGIKPNNYIQIGPVTFNKFNLSQDVMSFVPDFKDKGLAEGLVDYGKTWLGRTSPVIKTPIEIAMGGDYYQDGNMYPVNSKYSLSDNLAKKTAGLLGFTKTFQYGFDMANNIPSDYQTSDDNLAEKAYGYAKMMVQYQGNVVTQNEKDAFDQTKNRLYNYMEDELGKSYDPTPKYSTDKDQVRNGIKTGLKYNDQEYLDKMVAEYTDILIAEGKTMTEVRAQLKSVFRGQSLRFMGNISARDRNDFVQSLNVAEYEQYKKALNYERTIYGKYNYFLFRKR